MHGEGKHSSGASHLRSWILPAAVVTAAFALRIYAIDRQSAWFDESFSLVVARLPMREMFEALIRDFVHPPLHYLLLHHWFAIWGFGVFEARLLSVLFGTAAVALTYRLGALLFDRETGLLASMLLAVSQLAVMYSQEARPYAQLLFFVLLTLLCFVRAMREGSARSWALFAAAAAGMLYTHYYGVLVLAALALFAFLYRGAYGLKAGGLAAAAVIAASYIPWLTSGVVGQAIGSRKILPAEDAPWFRATWKTVPVTLGKFNNSAVDGVLNAAPLWALAAGVVLLTVPAALAIRRALASSPVPGAGALLALTCIVPVGSTVAASVMLKGQYDVRYVMFAVAPYYLLAAHGILSMRPKLLRRSTMVLLSFFCTYALAANYRIPYKENYRDALAYLASHVRPDDCTLFLPFNEPPLEWSVYVPNPPALHLLALDRVKAAGIDCQRVWAVRYRRVDFPDSREAYVRTKLSPEFVKAEGRRYFWIELDLYERAAQVLSTPVAGRSRADRTEGKLR